MNNAIAKWLKDKKNNILIPYTLSSCVFDDEGNSIDSIIRKGIGKEEIERLEKEIPKKVSQLENDKGYLTQDEVKVPTKVSQLENDKNYISADSPFESIKILDEITKSIYSLGISNGKFYIEDSGEFDGEMSIVFNAITIFDDVTKEKYYFGISNGKAYIEKEV